MSVTPPAACLSSLLINPPEAAGGARLALLDGTLYATTGFWIEGPKTERPDMMPAVARVEAGAVTQAAETWVLESSQNKEEPVIRAGASADGADVCRARWHLALQIWMRCHPRPR